MRHWKTLTFWFGRLLLAISLLAVPLSMSHASVFPALETVHVNHSMPSTTDGHANHDMEMMHTPAHSSEAVSLHEGHDAADCCSAICGGALLVELEIINNLLNISSGIMGIEYPLVSGEMVTPHRPPSI